MFVTLEKRSRMSFLSRSKSKCVCFQVMLGRKSKLGSRSRLQKLLELLTTLLLLGQS